MTECRLLVQYGLLKWQSSAPESGIVALEWGRQRSTSSKEPHARPVIAVCVDGRGVLNVVEDVMVLVICTHPTLRTLQHHGSPTETQTTKNWYWWNFFTLFTVSADGKGKKSDRGGTSYYITEARGTTQTMYPLGFYGQPPDDSKSQCSGPKHYSVKFSQWREYVKETLCTSMCTVYNIKEILPVHSWLHVLASAHVIEHDCSHSCTDGQDVSMETNRSDPTACDPRIYLYPKTSLSMSLICVSVSMKRFCYVFSSTKCLTKVLNRIWLWVRMATQWNLTKTSTSLSTLC